MARGVGKGLLEGPALQPGVCMAHTDPPVMVYTGSAFADVVFAPYGHF